MNSDPRQDPQAADQSDESGALVSASTPPAGLGFAAAAGDELRVRIDQRLVDLVRSAGEGSPPAEEIQRVLCDAGIGTLVKYYNQDVLFRRFTRLHIYLPAQPPNFRTEARAIIYLSVHTAAPRFMVKYVFGDAWDPQRASLLTCFVNACMLQFATEYRRYCGEERPTKGEEPQTEDDFEPDPRQHYAPRPPPDTHEQVVNRIEVERLLSMDMSPRDKIMFIRTAQGFSQREIAQELGMTEKAVSTRMRRNRRKFNG